MSEASLSDVIAAEANRLIVIPGVVGIAEGSDHGKPCIVVFVANEPSEEIPSSLSGYAVVVRRSGEIKAQ